MEHITTMKPLLKWVGGKTQILDEVLDTFPTYFKNYYEPFVGGGSVLIAILEKYKSSKVHIDGNIIASDINSRLIHMYKNIQTHPRLVWERLAFLNTQYQESHTDTEHAIVLRNPQNIEEAKTSPESMYYWQRKQYNASAIESIESAALFIFLNKTCFRGLHREGPNGFNVPYGNYKTVSFPDEQYFIDISELLQPVEFLHCSFEEVLRETTEGDLVYLDPPYAPQHETSFVGYTTNGFGKDMHDKLFTTMKSLTEKRVCVIMSNADVPSVRNSFTTDERFTIQTMNCRRAINSKNPGSRTNEVIVSNQKK